MTDEYFMQRCFDLALLGKQRVSPNPMVGAVLVYQGRIIGEGWHKTFGGPHAEVNAIHSVRETDEVLIRRATLYVSLEPCCFYGKTPPCTELIIESQINRVVISCLDDSPQVAGKGVARLSAAGIDVTTGVLEAKGKELSWPRSIFATTHRPYIILKYAQSRDGKFCPAEDRQYWISNAYSKRLVHKWRSEVDAILVGSRTARIDNPQLTNRLYYGPSPLRIVIDRRGSLSPDLNIFDGECPTLMVTSKRGALIPDKVESFFVNNGENLLDRLLSELHARKIGTLLVEGGLQILQLFLNNGYWDEARVFTGDAYLPGGQPAPDLGLAPVSTYELDNDELSVFRRTGSPG